MLKKKKNQKGFTLVELLVVIAIIGILAVVAVPALFKNINKAKVADVESDYSAIKSAVLSYYADENKIPITTKANDTVTPPVKEEKWNVKLATHMDSVPTESAFNGNYDLELAGDKALYLTIDKANITEEQLTRLTQDIGEGKVISKGKVVDLKNDGTVTGDSPADLAGSEVKIELQLISNTDM